MEKVGKIEITFVRDRGMNKISVNLIKDDRVFGFIKPVNFWR